ncbi:hypothetical protein DFH08DRAFT_921976 [Mycena albidolilacea]|uniref:DUF6589 domain-containing protein n=1 Tax=Mycena albidolilacea TaxID=1033008 RepID=A0AAD7EYQ8_9AGAR|nr:hypothetical protein DFH08DRAFT_921976 [Mycena albidolilacea]
MKIDAILSDIRTDRISPVDILIQVLDTQNTLYDRYRGNLYRNDSTKLSELLHVIMDDYSGKAKLRECLRKGSMLQGVSIVDPAFIEDWNLDEQIDTTPFLTQILHTAAQTATAKANNKLKQPEKMCQVVTQQLLYQSSNWCLAFQAKFGLCLWATGCARQTIDALFRCGLSICYDSVLSLIESLANHCMLEAIDFAAYLHGFCYDNMNLSGSIFVEQRGAGGPAKVTSGTFGVLYKLRNAIPEHMLVAPIMKCFKLSKGFEFNRDIRPTLDHLRSLHNQLIVVVIQRMFPFVPAFEVLQRSPALQHAVRRGIPTGYKMILCPLRAMTIEEATVRGNLLFHDNIYLNQLNEYVIPGFHDQLTNARIRSAQILRSKDTNTWYRHEIFQLGFGLFHLCLNLVWAILHVHRGKINEVGSLSYFFSLMEKVRLGNEQPNYHTLLAALMQILDGLLLNAWLQECGFASLQLFAESKPSPEKLREIAARILTEHATPIPSRSVPSAEPKKPPTSDAESSNTEDEPEQPPQSAQPSDDIPHQNLRILARDLLFIAAVIRAISDGDIGCVEVMLPHLAMMFRSSGCNKYCTEILHFIHNLKHVWTPELANIMQDNMIICISGLGAGHCMLMDLNIEHLIGYLKSFKILLQAKGLNSTWDRLGNISAAIVHLQRVKKKVAAALNAAYQNTGHTTPDTSHLVWRVQRKIAEEQLQQLQPGRSVTLGRKLTKNILVIGEAKLRSSTLGTFNKKIMAMIQGHLFEDDEDEVPIMSFSTARLPEE